MIRKDLYYVCIQITRTQMLRISFVMKEYDIMNALLLQKVHWKPTSEKRCAENCERQCCLHSSALNQLPIRSVTFIDDGIQRFVRGFQQLHQRGCVKSTFVV